MLQALYSVADMIIVGQVMEDVGLSAVGVGGDVTNLLAFVAMGFGFYGLDRISKKQKDKE